VTQICILGNSHAAAIRQGWKAIGDDYPDVAITFFAAPGPLLRELILRDGVLVTTNEQLASFFAMTSGGQSEIRLSDYDRVVIAGAGIGASRFSAIYRTHRPYDMLIEGTVPISHPCLLSSARGLLASSTGFRIARMIQTSVTFIPEPLPAPGFAQSDRWSGIWSDPIVRRHAAATFERALEDASSTVQSDVLPQPAETISDGFTLPIFSRDSPVFALDRKHREDEHSHMNGEFGAAVLQKLLA